MNEEIEKLNIKPGDWISVGGNNNAMGIGLDAVVCRINNDDIEVVYLDSGNRAINEDVVRKDGFYNFKSNGPSGGYADNYSRLKEFIAILKRGRR